MNSCRNYREKSSELVFLDVETTVPVKKEKRFRMLEFGAIVVCPRKLVEKKNYSTLVRPDDLSVVPENSSRIDGITREAVSTAPKFEEVADTIYSLLHGSSSSCIKLRDIFDNIAGKVWVGHNILRFDSVRIREAFSEIGRSAPKPSGMVDSLDILMNKFGPRAGNMKMASLAAYFGLGRQKHRSLDDARMNLQVIRCCATILFLESSLPHMLSARETGSPSASTRSRMKEKSSPDEINKKPPSTPSIGQRVKQSLLCRTVARPSIRHLLRHSMVR